MRTFSLLILVAFLCTSVTSFSQSEATVKTDVNKDVDVTVVYEQVVKEGYGTAYIYKELANAHYFKNNHVKAKKWFEKLFDIEKTTDETLLFRYKQTLKALKLDKSPNDYVSVSVSN
ncbi:tetratricopeptide repeat protein [Constantimarinum furrinae]|uniref:Flagellar motor protein MotB n=1 Tax=Constantimarinum furrinae TaxID=2562285 RepID=A0A7G8PSC4_9FLAO|nr:hypothetical protein [Constantimarinum furrinae]QNJ97240.1 hypothetical protein ALE3EI_0663 [Constantimarinum furrinae]